MTRQTKRNMQTKQTPVDAESMRRVGEALLNAQNRARQSSERADRCERLLRTVLSQVNIQTMASSVTNNENGDQEDEARVGIKHSFSLDRLRASTSSSLVLSDWDMLQSLIQDTTAGPSDSLQVSTNNHGVVTLDESSLEHHDDDHLPVPDMPVESDADSFYDIADITAEIVHHLTAAADEVDSWESDEGKFKEEPEIKEQDKILQEDKKVHTGLSFLKKVSKEKVSLLLDFVLHIKKRTELGLEQWNPWQFLAGVVFGFLVGVAFTRQYMCKPIPSLDKTAFVYQRLHLLPLIHAPQPNLRAFLYRTMQL